MGRHLLQKIASHPAELTVCFREVQHLTAERDAHGPARPLRTSLAMRPEGALGPDLIADRLDDLALRMFAFEPGRRPDRRTLTTQAPRRRRAHPCPGLRADTRP